MQNAIRGDKHSYQDLIKEQQEFGRRRPFLATEHGRWREYEEVNGRYRQKLRFAFTNPNRAIKKRKYARSRKVGHKPSEAGI